MAGFWNRVKQAFDVMRGKKDIEKLEKELSHSQKENEEIQQELANNREQMKRQSSRHNDLLSARDSKIARLNDQLRSRLRRAILPKKSENATFTLDEMVDEVLNYKDDGKSVKPVLVPEEVEKLIFKGKANLNYGYKGSICDNLAEACFRNPAESWAKPVLCSLFQAISQKEQERILASFPRHYTNYRNLSSLKFLDYAISLIPPDKLDLTPFITDWEDRKMLAREYRPEIFALLKKRGVFTPKNPSFKKIMDSIPLYLAPATDEKAVKARPWTIHKKRAQNETIPFPISVIAYISGEKKYCEWLEKHSRQKDGRANFDFLQYFESLRKETQLGHDKIMSASTPKERENAKKRFEDQLRENSDIYRVLTGKELWPDWQKTQVQPAKKSNTH